MYDKLLHLYAHPNECVLASPNDDGWRGVSGFGAENTSACYADAQQSLIDIASVLAKFT